MAPVMEAVPAPVPPREETRRIQLERLAAEVAERPQWLAVWKAHSTSPDVEKNRWMHIELARFSPQRMTLRLTGESGADWFTISDGEISVVRDFADGVLTGTVDMTALHAEFVDFQLQVDADLPAPGGPIAGIGGPCVDMYLLPDPTDASGGEFSLRISFDSGKPHPLGWWRDLTAWESARREGDTLVREVFADATATRSLTSGFLVHLERPGRFDCRLVELHDSVDPTAFGTPAPAAGGRDISREYTQSMREVILESWRGTILRRARDSQRPLAELAPALERLFARFHGKPLERVLRGNAAALAREIREWRALRADDPARAAERRADLAARIADGAASYLLTVRPPDGFAHGTERVDALLEIERATIEALYAATFADSLRDRLAEAERDG